MKERCEQIMNQIQTFGKNEVIFKEGDCAQCMYEIQSGSVNIYANFGKKDEKLLTTLEAGQFFGEIAIVEAMPRTATAIAAGENTALAEITSDNFSAYFQNKPEKLLDVMQHMSDRLRVLTREYLEARATIAEAIDTAKNGKQQSETLKGKIARLVQNLINPAFLKGDAQAYEEAAFLNAQANPQRVMKTFTKDEVIFREGDAANCLYDIHWGKVGIFANYGADNQSLLTELNADEFFGEMGLLSRLPRSATAVALEENTQVQLISGEVFSQYLQEKPAKVLMIMTHLSSRIRKLANDYMDVCRMAETAAKAEEDQTVWTDAYSDALITEYSRYDYFNHYHGNHLWF